MMNDRVDNAAPQADEIQSCDALVVGSGGAAVAGLKVLIVEKAATVGGTVWVPANHHALAQGVQDSPAEALTYHARQRAGRVA
ncbi:hypothetical protein BK025_11915 [Sodalis sp. TME1]|nr:hypothetical protein BK025_11915 [Sodalis sp. TME1]